MVLTRWRTIALALGLATASLAMPLPPALAHAASGPIVSLSGSPNPALSDSDNVLFSAHGTTDNSCAIKSYSFDFGDGYSTTSTYAFAYHYFHVPATSKSESFPVSLTVRDKCGNASSRSMAEVVDEDTPPAAHLTVSHGSSNRYSVFANASDTTENAESVPYEFDFYWGDGSETTTYFPTEFAPHKYALAGTFDVSVQVLDYAGVQGSASANVVVPSSPQAAAPSNVQAVAGNTTADISWSKPLSGGTPQSFTVAATPSGPNTTVGSHASQATVTGLVNGNTYSFTVTANYNGATAMSQPSNPVVPIGPPGAPILVSAIAADSAAVVSWSAPTTDISSIPLSHHQAPNYIVTTSPGNARTLVSGDPAPTNVTIDGLTNGTAYTFTVTAANASFTGPPSSSSNPVMPSPIGPTIVTPAHWKLIEPSVVGTSATNLPLTITVLWSGRAGSTPICSYALQRSLDNEPWTNVALPSPNVTAVTDTIPTSLVRVRYQVQATDCAGIVSSWVQSPEFGYQLFEENNTKFAYTGSWTRISCASCAGGFAETTTESHATAILTLNAAYNLGLVLEVGPSLGSVRILQDGRLVDVVSTFASTVGYRYLLFKTGWQTFGYHIIQLINLGTSGHPGVVLDGVVVLYAPLARLG